MFISHEQNARQNHSLAIGDKPFECVAQFKYLRITQTNQNCTHEEVKCRLKSVSACYHNSDYLSVQRYLTGSYNRDMACLLSRRTGSLN